MTIEKIKKFAIEKHGTQKYGKHDYSVHLNDVVEILESFGYQNYNMIASAWLHDVVEDQNVTIEEIKNLAGADVADIVRRVTDEPGRNRAERKAKTYDKIAGSFEATVVKLADRIANVKRSLSENSGLLKMYKNEHSTFKSKLYNNFTDRVLLSMQCYLDALMSDNKNRKNNNEQ